MKLKEIEHLFYYWCGRLKIKDKIEICRDNRIDTFMLVESLGNKHILRYNTKRIFHNKKAVILWTLFHEIGHIKNKLPYETDDEKIKSEMEAERYAFKIIKKYFPEEYKYILKRIKNKKLMNHYRKKEPVYYYAYRNLKEYR